ncbi:MAG: ABC transporter permease [Bifidobacteriaceae bacterium]|jgi:ABC-2 type transport system permease protein|nr:ABC transporter permease [Bifidobacteriaceae bacterium]
MSWARTRATAFRVLRQLGHDRASLAIMLAAPCIVLGLVAWLFWDSPTPVLDRFGPILLAVIPAVVMFLVASVATLRERTGGTLERLMAMPLGRGDFVTGYALGLGVAAVAQAVVVTAWLRWVCRMDQGRWPGLMVLVAVMSALLGAMLGLAASALARTEFQAVQLMPAVILPQLAICGLIMPREQMPRLLDWVSDVLPFSYAVDAMRRCASAGGRLGLVWRDIGVVAGFIALALVVAAATLRRRTR